MLGSRGSSETSYLFFGGLISQELILKEERQWGGGRAGWNQTVLSWCVVCCRRYGKAAQNTALGSLCVCEAALFPINE